MGESMVSRRAALAGAFAAALGMLPLAGCVRPSKEDASTEEYEFDGVTAIELELGAGEVIVRRDDRLAVTVERVNYPEVIVEEVDGILHISEGANDAKLLEASVCKVDITVPEGCELDKLDLEVDAGRILVSDVVAREASLASNAGDVTLERGTVDDATLFVSAGAITVSDFAGVQDATVTLEVEVGELRFLGEVQEGSYQQTGSGPSLMATVEVGSLEVS